jgi:hypothetical protein
VAGQAAFPAHGLRLSHLQPPLPDTYWQPRWDVHLGRNQIEIVDATGIVTKFFAFDTSDNRPAGAAMPRSQALARAVKIVHAAGVSESLGAPQVMEMQMASPPQRDTHLWNIIYPRQFQGHPVSHQQMTIMLQAETGELRAVGVTFPTPLPAPAAPQITVASAQANASTRIKQLQGTDFLFRQAQLEWVQPNGQTFSPRGRETTVNGETPGGLRLVWNCLFTEKNHSYAEVWVDAQTGKIIGGEIASI